MQLHEDFMREQREIPEEWNVVTRAGEVLTILADAAYIIGTDGTPKKVTFVIDITRRKQAEEQLRLTQISIDRSADGIHWLASDGSHLYVNDSVCQSLGYTRDELLNLTIPDIDLNFSAENFGDIWNKVKEQGALTIESVHRCKNGNTIPMEITANYLALNGKEYVFAFSRNIAERKAAEEQLQRLNAQLRQQTDELRHNQALLRQILDNAPAAISVKDIQWRYMLVNQTYASLLHVEREQLIGKVDDEVFTTGVVQTWKQNEQRVLESGKPVQVEEHITLDDEPHTFLTSKFPIYDAQETLYAIGSIATDVTEQRRMERERAELQAQIIETQQAAIRELSTPLLPLAENVVALPLVGTIDSQRAQQVMETLLEGIATYQADIAIVDITGVRVVDTQVAQALIRTAQAVRLLGAQVVLTGIQPQIAQTLVHLGTDLSGIVTTSTLQSGITYALKDGADQWKGEQPNGNTRDT
jgi:PAS domain S-box-containing protein